MLSLIKQIYVEYCTFIVKMHARSAKSNVVGKILNVFCDVELNLGLSCIFTLLETMHRFIKISQSRDFFVCDFVKLAHHEFYRLYYDPLIKFV
jgi:hypothetical protein